MALTIWCEWYDPQALRELIIVGGWMDFALLTTLEFDSDSGVQILDL